MSSLTATIVNVTDYRTENCVDIVWKIGSGQQQTTRLSGDDYTEAKTDAFSDSVIITILNREPV